MFDETPAAEVLPAAPQQSGTDTLKRPDSSLRPYVLASVVVVLLMGGAVFGWAGTAKLAGAVIAGGTVVVDSSAKRVQHPSGGIVGELRVREGTYVRENQIIVRLDETVTRANLQVVVNQIEEIEMREKRLKAERDGAGQVDLPASFAGRENDPLIAEIIKGERLLFESRFKARNSQKSQLQERIAQLKLEIDGLREQQAATMTQLELGKAELADVEPLLKRGLVQLTRVNTMKREISQLEGAAGQLTAQIAQAGGKIVETELQILQVDQDLRSEIVKELSEAQAIKAELVERRVAAEDQLKRIDIRSPQTGTVHQLQVHTVGGVVNAGETLMMIIPEGDKLVIEARVRQQDIEQVRLKQDALLRFTAFNSRTTPELSGTVERISADLVREEQTGLAYFVIRIVIPDTELQKLNGGRLLPGMPVDVQIKTEERTALSYMVRPFTDQVARAFRER
jgi:HlyD family secretion protein